MNKDFHIVFIDEAGCMLNPLTRTTWARRGHTPVLKIADNPHDRISVIGAIAIKMVEPRRFSFLFHLSADNTNFRGHTVVPFLEHLYIKLHGYINLVWDSIKIHTAEPVNIFLALHPAMKVFFSPPYAPELNPVDNVWGYIKCNRLANFCPHDLVELEEARGIRPVAPFPLADTPGMERTPISARRFLRRPSGGLPSQVKDQAQIILQVSGD